MKVSFPQLISIMKINNKIINTVEADNIIQLRKQANKFQVVNKKKIILKSYNQLQEQIQKERNELNKMIQKAEEKILILKEKHQMRKMLKKMQEDFEDLKL